MRRHILAALAAVTVLGMASSVRAETILLNSGSGADFDAVGDGWLFAGSPSATPDGVGDADAQLPAVGRINGTLELRAMGEFSMAPIAGLTASQIASATVTMTIDDVIGTFGPGATFDGTASDPIAVYHYVGNGTVTAADFAAPGLSQLGIVTPGVVTDASLAVSGPLPFTVDATLAVKTALTNGDTFFGVLFGTTDSPTATSLDGVLPYITIETVPLAPPQLSGDEQACQTTISKSGQKLAATAMKGFSTCFGAILKDVGADATLDPATTTKCAGQLDPANPASKVAKAVAKVATDVAKKCDGLVPADIGSPCDAGATTFDAVATCIVDKHLEAAEALARAQYAGACTLAIAVDLDDDYPALCD
jgi:hypothetical protein